MATYVKVFPKPTLFDATSLSRRSANPLGARGVYTVIGVLIGLFAWLVMGALVAFIWALAREAGATQRTRRRVVWMFGGVLLAPSLLPVSIVLAIPLPFGVVAILGAFAGDLSYIAKTWQYQVPSVLVTAFVLRVLIAVIRRMAGKQRVRLESENGT